MLVKGKVPQLGELTADVWVDERHRRELEVTQNPIEFGAPVTDHAFVKGRVLSIRFGVTNTPIRSNNSFTSNDRVSEARDKLFAMQDDATFLDVTTITGGVYKNCLLAGIGWSTDSTNPNAVIFELDLQEVIITTTAKTTYQPLPADERTDKKTSTTEKRGESPLQSRDEADEARRNHTADASQDADELAKSKAAQAQADKVAAPDNRTYLKKLAGLIGDNI